MRHRRSWPVAVTIAAALIVATTGCGPRLALHAGVQTELTSLLIGPPPAAPQLPAVVGPVVVPSYAGVPAAAPQAPITPPPPPPAPPCPPLGRNSFPPTAATSTIDNAPHPGRYIYRQSGRSQVDGKAAGKLAGNVVVPVAARAPETSAQTAAFTVTTPSFESATISTTVAIQPAAASAGVPPTAATDPMTVGPPAGLFITKIVTTAGNSTTTFSPSPPGVQVFAQPAGRGTTWQGTATDPTATVSVTVRGSVVGNTHVNACGNALDAVKVTLDETVAGISENLTESHVLGIGTEYGGLILSDERAVTGTISGHQVDQASSLTINSIAPLPTRGRR